MKIGILTGGGDCPGLNAAIRAVTLKALGLGWEVVGIHEGWAGLLPGGKSKQLGAEEVESIYDIGGTIIGTSRTNPAKMEGGIKQVAQACRELELDALVAIGGEDTLGVAAKLWKQEKIPVVGVPKTVDHDIMETDYTIGFDTAVNVASESIDRLHTTAKSHRRVIIVEIMGRHAGWLTLRAGIAGGAHVILIPEKGYDINAIAETIKSRRGKGLHTIIALSEGVESPIQLKEGKDSFGHVGLTDRGLAHTFEAVLEERTGVDIKVMVLGHLLRGGTPTAYDRAMATRVGSAAVDFVKERKFGMMAAVQGAQIVAVELGRVGGKWKTVPDQEYELLKPYFEGEA
ncbi:MAG: ATP-dependent 6-phosphofructokinase [Candidatus Micrarchaeota archaeon]